jgi:hypothetical protein
VGIQASIGGSSSGIISREKGFWLDMNPLVKGGSGMTQYGST